MIFENDFSSNRQEGFEERLKAYAYIYLAQVGNLNEVIYEYTLDGEEKTLSVTSSDASEFIGVDIKKVGRDINLLEKLIRKTELTNVVLGGVAVESNAQVDSMYSNQTQDVLEFSVINYAEDGICGMGLNIDCDDVSGHQSMSAADGSTLENGLNVDLQLIPEDFAKEIPDGSKADIRLRVMDADGNTHDVQGVVYADLYWGNKYQLILSGNAEEGYFLGQ